MATIGVVKASNQAIVAWGKRIRHSDVVCRVKDEARRPSLVVRVLPSSGTVVLTYTNAISIYQMHKRTQRSAGVLLQAKSVE